MIFFSLTNNNNNNNISIEQIKYGQSWILVLNIIIM